MNDILIRLEWELDVFRTKLMEEYVREVELGKLERISGVYLPRTHRIINTNIMRLREIITILERIRGE